MNMRLKSTFAAGSPGVSLNLASGKVASTMGAAPRNPTHDTKIFSLKLSHFEGMVIITESGRATSMRKNARSVPLTSKSGSSFISRNKPSEVKSATCMSHETPSLKRVMPFW